MKKLTKTKLKLVIVDVIFCHSETESNLKHTEKADTAYGKYRCDRPGKSPDL